MKTENALKAIEMLLEMVNTDNELAKLQELVINKRISLSVPRKRAYKRNEHA